MSELLIAYVEDSSADADLLKRALLQMLPDAELLHFRDAESAKEFFEELSRSRNVALAIVDLKLPRMSGERLISWIRGQPSFAALPIIAVSSGQAFATTEEARVIGATDFQLKPRTYNDYIDLVYSIREVCQLDA